MQALYASYVANVAPEVWAGGLPRGRAFGVDTVDILFPSAVARRAGAGVVS